MKRAVIYAACCILFLSGCASTPSLLVTSDPAGASVLIDGEQVGKTPATLKVKFEQNAQMITEKKILTIRMQGYTEQKEVLSCDWQAKKTLKFTLQPEAVNTTDNIVKPQAKPADLLSTPSATREQPASPSATVSAPSATAKQPK